MGGKGKLRNQRDTCHWRKQQPTAKCILVERSVLLVVSLHGYMAAWGMSLKSESSSNNLTDPFFQLHHKLLWHFSSVELGWRISFIFILKKTIKHVTTTEHEWESTRWLIRLQLVWWTVLLLHTSVEWWEGLSDWVGLGIKRFTLEREENLGKIRREGVPSRKCSFLMLQSLTKKKI